MKKNFLLMLLAVVLCFATLTGCQSQAKEPENVCPSGYYVSDIGYEDINYVNENYLIVYQNGKYGVIALDGTVVLDFEWDNWSRFADGYFALGQNIGENLRHGVLFDENCVEVFNNDGLQNMYISSFNENVIQLTSLEKNENEGYNSLYLKLDENNQTTTIVDLNESTVSSFMRSSACSNGKIMIRMLNCTTFEKGDFVTYYDVATGEYNRTPSHFIPFPYAISDEGYMNGHVVDPETGTMISMKVYNYNEGVYYDLPTDVTGTHNLSYIPNVSVTVADNGIMKVKKDTESAMALFDLKSQSYLSDFVYSYINLEDFRENNYALISNVDKSQWSYLKKDFTEHDTWYEDATSFNDGYAVVKENGKLHFVNENFETVFEEIEGDASYALGGVKNAFVVEKEGLYYLLQLTYE